MASRPRGTKTTGAADAGTGTGGHLRREVLERLDQLLWRFGTANDADDRQCGEEGAQLRLSAAAGIRALMRAHPFLVEMLPALADELESKHIEGFGWSTLVDALAPELAARKDHDRRERQTP